MKFLKYLYFFLFLSSICFSSDEATYAQMFAASFDNANFSKV